MKLQMNTDKHLNKFKARIKDKDSFDRHGQNVSGKLDARAHKNLIISTVLNGTMLICAALSVFFMRGINDAGILIASLIDVMITTYRL